MKEQLKEKGGEKIEFTKYSFRLEKSWMWMNEKKWMNEWMNDEWINKWT